MTGAVGLTSRPNWQHPAPPLSHIRRRRRQNGRPQPKPNGATVPRRHHPAQMQTSKATWRSMPTERRSVRQQEHPRCGAVDVRRSKSLRHV